MFHHGPMIRTRKMHKRYLAEQKSRPKVTTCIFCDLTRKDPQVLEAYPLFMLVKNIYPYAVWDSCRVLEHYLILPKRHMASLDDMTKKERAEYADLVARAEKDGFALYTRSDSGITKSVTHVHTHLIKLENRRINVLFFLKKPHWLLYK